MEVGAAGAVAEDPLVAPGLVEPAEVAGGDPLPAFLGVPAARPLVGEPPQVVVQHRVRVSWTRRSGGSWPGRG